MCEYYPGDRVKKKKKNKKKHKKTKKNKKNIKKGITIFLLVNSKN